MTTAASLPFFLFTLLAEALADLSNRRVLSVATHLWLASAAGLLAIFSWLHLAHPYVILAAVFLIGTGFAFSSRLWACFVPEIVRGEELPSAVTLGGVQLNFASIVGPVIGGVLLPIVGSPVVFSLNALAFLGVALVIFGVYHPERRRDSHLEDFLELFTKAFRYVIYMPRLQVTLTLCFLFNLFIAAVPALVPVVALRQLRLPVSQLGLVFTAMGVGSLLTATLFLPYARQRATPNLLTILAGALLAAILILMAIAQNLWVLLLAAALANLSWTVLASELWIAVQLAMPDWARGRMNALHMMVSQGGLALGAVIWGVAAASFGLGVTLVGGALLFAASLMLAIPLSIKLAGRLELDLTPFKAGHDRPAEEETRNNGTEHSCPERRVEWRHHR